MQKATEYLTTAPEGAHDLEAAAARPPRGPASRSSSEGEDAGVVLAPGTSRRRALDDALAEMDAGEREPSSRWKVRYGLMLGLERVLSRAAAQASPRAPSCGATRSTRSPGC